MQVNQSASRPLASWCKDEALTHIVIDPATVPNTQRGSRLGTQCFTGTCRHCLQDVIDCSGDFQSWHWMADFQVDEQP